MAGEMSELHKASPEVQRFTKRAVTIEALQYDGSPNSAAAVCFWIGFTAKPEPGQRAAWVDDSNGVLRIRTLESGEGWHIAAPGDWIIRGVKGEFYPCKPDIFAATYSPESALVSPAGRAPSDEAVVNEMLRGNGMLEADTCVRWLARVRAAEQRLESRCVTPKGDEG